MSEIKNTEIQVLNTAVLQPKGLKGSAKVVYELLVSKIQNKEVLGLKEVVHAFADAVIKPDKISKIGCWPGGRYEPKEFNTREYTKENWQRTAYNGQAIQWLKYHIGNLVLNGHIIAIPVINFDANEKQLEGPGTNAE